MAGNEVSIDIRAYDHASGVINQIEQRLGVFSKQGLAVGAGFAVVNQAMNLAMQGIGKLEQFIVGSIDAYKNWEVSIVQVSNALSQQDQALLPSIIANVNEMSLAYGESATKLMESYDVIVKSGANAAAGLAVLTSAERLAKAQNIDLANSTGLLTDTMKTWNYSSRDSESIANKLAKTMDTTTLSADDLDNMIGSLGPTLSQTGTSLDQFLAILMTLNQEGFNNSRKMMSAISTGLNAMLNPTADAIAEYNKLGIALDPLILQGEGLTNVIKRVQEATGGDISALSKLVGTGQAVAFMNAMMSDGMVQYAKNLDLVGGSTDQLQQDFTKMMGTFSGRMDQINTMFSQMQKNIGSGLIGGGSEMMGYEQQALAETGQKMGITFSENFRVAYLKDMHTGFTTSVLMEPLARGAYGVGSPVPIAPGFAEEYQKNLQNLVSSAAFTMKTEPVTNFFDTFKTSLIEQSNLLSMAELNLKQYTLDLSDMQTQLANMPALHNMTEALRFIPLALDNASYQSRIFTGALTDQDKATLDLITSIRQHRAELDALSKQANDYANQMTANSIEEMKIQLDVSDNRGRITREEKDQLKELARADLELRVKQAENSLKQGQLQNGVLSDEQRQLQDIETAYQVHIQDLNDTYQKDYDNLQNSIAAKKLMITYYTDTFIPDQNKKLLDLETCFADDYNKVVNSNDFTATEKKQLEDLLAQALATYNGIIRARNQAMGTNQPEMGAGGEQIGNTYQQRWQQHIAQYHHGFPSPFDQILMAGKKEPIPGLAVGGTVAESGIAVVHKGELVLPRNLVGKLPDLQESSSPIIMSQPSGKSGDTHVEINVGPVTINAKNADSVEDWGRKLAQGLSSGFLEASSGGTTTATSRKTGGTIIVPGTTVTTRTLRTPTATIPVNQPIRHKGRFRAG